MLKCCSVFLSILLVLALFGTQALMFENVGESYCFYVGDASSCCEMINTNIKDARKIKRTLNAICGESFKTFDKKEVQFVVDNYAANLQFSESFGGTKTSYYYSSKISYYKIVKGKKVNIQTACSNEEYTVGTPLIFGSF